MYNDVSTLQLARAYTAGIQLLLHPDSDILAHQPYDAVAVLLPSPYAESVLRATLQRIAAALRANGIEPIDALYSDIEGSSGWIASR